MPASQPANFNLQEFSDAGLLLVGGRLYTYAYGTTAQKTAYTDPAGAVPHTYTADGAGGQYIALNARGELPSPLYLATGSYDLTLKRGDGSTIWTRKADGIDNTPNSLAAALAASIGASLIGFIQAGVGALLRTVQDKLRERVTPQDFGAVGDGIADDTLAIQKALNTNKAIDFGDASITYLITDTITHTGPVYLRAKGATIKASVLPMHFTDAGGSWVDGLRFMPLVTPYTILRNTTTWVNVIGDVVQSLEGYMPTTQDADLWPTLPANVKAQYDNFQPGGILFDVSSVAGGKYILVENISGYQACITLSGYSYSVVRNCTHNGKREAIDFINARPAAFGTLPRGVNNSAVGNKTKYAGQCGIQFSGNDYFRISGNDVSYCGESGTKTQQYDGSNTVDVICTNGVITANTVYNQYHDGIDATLVYGPPGLEVHYSGTVTANNVVYNNRHTGISANGINCAVSGNQANHNGSHGISAKVDYSSVTGNTCKDNSAHPEIHTTFQIFDLVIQGNGNVSTGNQILNLLAPSTWNYVHSGSGGVPLSPSQEGLDNGNWCSGGNARMYVEPTIPSSTNGFLVGYGTRELTNNAIAVFRQGGGGVDIGGSGNTGYVRIRGDSSASAQIDYTTNTTDPAGGTIFQARTLYDFTGNLFRFLINGGTNSLYFQSAVGLYPSPDNTLSLGASSLRWSQVYAGSATISTSDAREKQQVGEIDVAVLRAWSRVQFQQFKFNDAVELKGDGARWHFGVIAQQVKAAFESEGLDPFAFGVLCYDEWDAAPARYSVNEETGEQIEVSEAIAAGNRYGVRYEEALVLECAYLRSKLPA